MSNALQKKKLSKQNLESFQDYLTSLSHLDTVLEWIPLTSTMTGSDSAGAVSKEKKLLQSAPTVASSPGSKYSRQYTQTLYEFGISESISAGTIPSVPGQTEACKYFSELIEIPLLSGFMQEWFLMFEPNKATLVNYFCELLFPQNFSIRNEPRVVILHDFSGPFKAHDLYELERGDEGINYPTIQSDFVFAASLNWFGGHVQSKIRVHGNVSPLPCVCNNLRSCAVAIVAEAKATASSASFAAAKNQWSSLAYVQLMERMSISRETPYVGDENICQYGYGICGLEIIIWKMSLQWNRSKHRKSEILEKYFTFPIQTVATFDLVKQEDLEGFIAVHKKLLQWWLNGYLPSYIKDLTKIITAHPENPAKWITSWQEAAATCGCLVNHLPDFLLILAQSIQIPMAKGTAK